jgi:hypothetical protein
LIYFEGGRWKIDLEKYSEWENSRNIRHFNKLSVHNPTVRQIIKLLREKYEISYIMGKLHRYYWQQCDSIAQFENSMQDKINNNIEGLENLIRSG